MEENDYSPTAIILSELDQKNEECVFREIQGKSVGVTKRMTWAPLVVLCLILLCGLIALGVLYSLKIQQSSASLCSLEPHIAEKHTQMSDFLEAQNRNLSASMSSLQQKLADKHIIAESLEVQNKNLSASLFSVEQKLTEKNSFANFLEVQNRNISASLSSLQQKLADEYTIAESLEAQNRNLSAYLFSVEQKLTEKHTQMSDFLEAQNRNLSASMSSLQQKLADKHIIAESLEVQNKNLSASLFSVEQKLTEKNSFANFLEVQNRNISASLSSLQQKLADEYTIAESLEAQNRNLSAYLFSVEQKLTGTERQLQELQANHSEVMKTLLSCKANGGCDSGWRNHLGQCYLFSTEKLNWIQSRDYCISRGAKLVIINFEQEQAFVASSISETHWIGLSDLGTEGQWRWVDNTPLSQTKIQFWHRRENGKHEPDNWTGGGDRNGEDCAAIGDDEDGALSQ
ncbi:hypothetical protein COCON_G00050070 [Conger conger]|uniref:C-type lectin domain-containing protein n=3 Tax=Conger conger TaxID=82655 RepID=A0A9Q1DVH7_CONCO|nr:hypothetical protein COCON_G00050070 [Conger conger]